MGRLFFNVLECRDAWLSALSSPADRQANQNAFDKAHRPIFEALLNALEAAENGVKLIDAHLAKGVSGDIFRFDRGHLHISENIDKPLRKHFEDLHIQGVIGLKAIKTFSAQFGLNLHFFFAIESKFKTGLQALRKNGDGSLAEFLESTRTNWSHDFINRRANIEHNGFTLDKVKYVQVAPTAVTIGLPLVANKDLRTFFIENANRILLLAETLIFFSIQHSLGTKGWLVEIPTSERSENRLGRFKYWPVALSFYNWEPWKPQYQDTFDFIK